MLFKFCFQDMAQQFKKKKKKQSMSAVHGSHLFEWIHLGIEMWTFEHLQGHLQPQIIDTWHHVLPKSHAQQFKSR